MSELEHLYRQYEERGGAVDDQFLDRCLENLDGDALPEWLRRALRRHLTGRRTTPKHLTDHYRRWVAIDHHVVADGVSVTEAVRRVAHAENKSEESTIWRSYRIVRDLQNAEPDE